MSNILFVYVLCCIFLSFVEGVGVDFGANLVSKRGAGGQKEVRVAQNRPKMRSRWSPEATLGTTLAPRKINAIA